MDKSQLVTIAVTAIITAFIKEIAGALLLISKNFATSTTVREKIAAALTPNKIVATINLVLLLFCAWNVYGYVSSPVAVDRFAVFNIAYFTGLAILSIARIDMILMIHSESTLQTRLLPARIRLEIARLEKELKEAADEKEYNDALEKLKTILERPLPEADKKSLPPKPPDNVQQ